MVCERGVLIIDVEYLDDERHRSSRECNKIEPDLIHIDFSVFTTGW